LPHFGVGNSINGSHGGLLIEIANACDNHDDACRNGGFHLAADSHAAVQYDNFRSDIHSSGPFDEPGCAADIHVSCDNFDRDI
jgi:hypothetical protein